MNPSTVAPTLDRQAVARERTVFASKAPWLHDTVASSMVERLRWMKEPPTSWLDWEPSWGGQEAEHLLAQQYPNARRWVYERGLAPSSAAAPPKPKGWLSRVISPKKPKEDRWDGQPSVDMVWANMALRGEADPQTLMQRWRQALKPHGFVMFTGLGPHTLASLASIYQRHGWGEPFAPFTDMHDWGDMLVSQGFENPVLDSSFLKLTYSSVTALLADLRQMGRNAHPARYPALRSRAWMAALTQALAAELERDLDGRWVLTLEIVHGHAVNPVGVKAQGEVTAIPVGQMQDMLRRR